MWYKCKINLVAVKYFFQLMTWGLWLFQFVFWSSEWLVAIMAAFRAG